MSDLLPPDELHPDEVHEADPVVARNLRILERAFIPNIPNLTDPEEQAASERVTHGERKVEGVDTVIMATNIRFDTRTGEIIKPDFNDPQLRDGDISVLRTYLITEGEHVDFNESTRSWDTTPGKYRILLAYPKDWLTPHAITAAVQEQYSGGDGVDPLESEGQWILPERIKPAAVKEYGSSIAGPQEPWGRSRFVENPGDMKLFHAIEAFNRKHGPSLAEQLFRKAPVPK